jgi:hypothetical protein
VGREYDSGERERERQRDRERERKTEREGERETECCCKRVMASAINLMVIENIYDRCGRII